MGHAPGDPYFILETLQQSFVACRLIRKKLESHRLAEREIVGAVHLTHAAFSQQG
jgi:hypothetical protein